MFTLNEVDFTRNGEAAAGPFYVPGAPFGDRLAHTDEPGRPRHEDPHQAFTSNIPDSIMASRASGRRGALAFQSR